LAPGDSIVAKFLIPHTIRPHAANVSVDPSDPDHWQLSFWEGEQDVHHVLLRRDQIGELGKLIERRLKQEAGHGHQ
jgi:hypothetical protein